MQDFTASFFEAFRLVLGLNPGLLEIVWLSLKVSMTAVVIAAIVGLPIGAFLAVSRFPGRSVVIVSVSALMGLPPVVVGLVVYLLLSNAGALGPLQLLYTPTAMIIAITGGWALGGASSPFTATTLLIGGLGGVSAAHVGLRWNGLYTLICGALISALAVGYSSL